MNINDGTLNRFLNCRFCNDTGEYVEEYLDCTEVLIKKGKRTVKCIYCKPLKIINPNYHIYHRL